MTYCVCGSKLEMNSGFCEEGDEETHEPRHDIGPCVVCNMPNESRPEPKLIITYEEEPSMPTSTQSHYKELSPEPIEVIRAWHLDNDFYLGNVVKYIARHQKKNGLEDLQKAAVYLQWAIERLQAAQIDGPNFNVRGN